MYKLICRGVTKTNHSFTKFKDVYKRVIKQRQLHTTSISQAQIADHGNKKRPAQISSGRSGTTLRMRVKTSFKALLFPKNTGGQVGKLSAKHFYSTTNSRAKDASMKKAFRDRKALNFYKEAMQQCAKIKCAAASLGLSPDRYKAPHRMPNWGENFSKSFMEKVKEHQMKQFTTEEIRAKTPTLKGHILVESAAPIDRFVATSSGGNTKIIYPVRRMRYTIKQSTPPKRRILEDSKKANKDTTPRHKISMILNRQHTMEFVPRKLKSEPHMTKARQFKTDKVFSTTTTKLQHKPVMHVTRKPTVSKITAAERKPTIKKVKVASQVWVANQEARLPEQSKMTTEDAVPIQKHPTVRKITKYGKMEINKKYNFLLKLSQAKKAPAYHIVKPIVVEESTKTKEIPTEYHVLIPEKQEPTLLVTAKPSESILDHQAASVEPQSTDHLYIQRQHGKSVLIHTDRNFDIDEVCLKSKEKSTPRVDSIHLSNVNSTKQPSTANTSSTLLKNEQDEKADAERYYNRQKAVAQDLKDYLSKLQQLREQTSIERSVKFSSPQRPKLVQEAQPHNLKELEKPAENVKVIKPGDLFKKKMKIAKRSVDIENSLESDVNVQTVETLKTKTSEQKLNKPIQAKLKHNDNTHRFSKLLAHSNRELRNIKNKMSYPRPTIKLEDPQSSTFKSKTPRSRYLLQDYRKGESKETTPEKVTTASSLKESTKPLGRIYTRPELTTAATMNGIKQHQINVVRSSPRLIGLKAEPELTSDGPEAVKPIFRKPNFTNPKTAHMKVPNSVTSVTTEKKQVAPRSSKSTPPAERVNDLAQLVIKWDNAKESTENIVATDVKIKATSEAKGTNATPETVFSPPSAREASAIRLARISKERQVATKIGGVSSSIEEIPKMTLKVPHAKISKATQETAAVGKVTETHERKETTTLKTRSAYKPQIKSSKITEARQPHTNPTESSSIPPPKYGKKMDNKEPGSTNRTEKLMDSKTKLERAHQSITANTADEEGKTSALKVIIALKPQTKSSDISEAKQAITDVSTKEPVTNSIEFEPKLEAENGEKIGPQIKPSELLEEGQLIIVPQTVNEAKITEASVSKNRATKLIKPVTNCLLECKYNSEVPYASTAIELSKQQQKVTRTLKVDLKPSEVPNTLPIKTKKDEAATTTPTKIAAAVVLTATTNQTAQTTAINTSTEDKVQHDVDYVSDRSKDYKYILDSHMERHEEMKKDNSFNESEGGLVLPSTIQSRFSYTLENYNPLLIELSNKQRNFLVSSKSMPKLVTSEVPLAEKKSDQSLFQDNTETHVAKGTAPALDVKLHYTPSEAIKVPDRNIVVKDTKEKSNKSLEALQGGWKSCTKDKPLKSYILEDTPTDKYEDFVESSKTVILDITPRYQLTNFPIKMASKCDLAESTMRTCEMIEDKHPKVNYATVPSSPKKYSCLLSIELDKNVSHAREKEAASKKAKYGERMPVSPNGVNVSNSKHSVTHTENERGKFNMICKYSTDKSSVGLDASKSDRKTPHEQSVKESEKPKEKLDIRHPPVPTVPTPPPNDEKKKKDKQPGKGDIVLPPPRQPTDVTLKLDEKEKVREKYRHRRYIINQIYKIIQQKAMQAKVATASDEREIFINIKNQEESSKVIRKNIKKRQKAMGRRFEEKFEPRLDPNHSKFEGNSSVQKLHMEQVEPQKPMQNKNVYMHKIKYHPAVKPVRKGKTIKFKKGYPAFKIAESETESNQEKDNALHTKMTDDKAKLNTVGLNVPKMLVNIIITKEALGKGTNKEKMSETKDTSINNSKVELISNLRLIPDNTMSTPPQEAIIATNDELKRPPRDSGLIRPQCVLENTKEERHTREQAHETEKLEEDKMIEKVPSTQKVKDAAGNLSYGSVFNATNINLAINNRAGIPPMATESVNDDEAALIGSRLAISDQGGQCSNRAEDAVTEELAKCVPKMEEKMIKQKSCRQKLEENVPPTEYKHEIVSTQKAQANLYAPMNYMMKEAKSGSNDDASHSSPVVSSNEQKPATEKYYKYRLQERYEMHPWLILNDKEIEQPLKKKQELHQGAAVTEKVNKSAPSSINTSKIKPISNQRLTIDNAIGKPPNAAKIATKDELNKPPRESDLMQPQSELRNKEKIHIREQPHAAAKLEERDEVIEKMPHTQKVKDVEDKFRYEDVFKEKPSAGSLLTMSDKDEQCLSRAEDAAMKEVAKDEPKVEKKMIEQKLCKRKIEEKAPSVEHKSEIVSTHMMKENKNSFNDEQAASASHPSLVVNTIRSAEKGSSEQEPATERYCKYRLQERSQMHPRLTLNDKVTEQPLREKKQLHQGTPVSEKRYKNRPPETKRSEPPDNSTTTTKWKVKRDPNEVKEAANELIEETLKIAATVAIAHQEGGSNYINLIKEKPHITTHHSTTEDSGNMRNETQPVSKKIEKDRITEIDVNRQPRSAPLTVIKEPLELSAANITKGSEGAPQRDTTTAKESSKDEYSKALATTNQKEEEINPLFLHHSEIFVSKSIKEKNIDIIRQSEKWKRKIFRQDSSTQDAGSNQVHSIKEIDPTEETPSKESKVNINMATTDNEVFVNGKNLNETKNVAAKRSRPLKQTKNVKGRILFRRKFEVPVKTATENFKKITEMTELPSVGRLSVEKQLEVTTPKARSEQCIQQNTNRSIPGSNAALKKHRARNQVVITAKSRGEISESKSQLEKENKQLPQLEEHTNSAAPNKRASGELEENINTSATVKRSLNAAYTIKRNKVEYGRENMEAARSKSESFIFVSKNQLEKDTDPIEETKQFKKTSKVRTRKVLSNKKNAAKISKNKPVTKKKLGLVVLKPSKFKTKVWCSKDIKTINYHQVNMEILYKDFLANILRKNRKMKNKVVSEGNSTELTNHLKSGEKLNTRYSTSSEPDTVKVFPETKKTVPSSDGRSNIVTEPSSLIPQQLKRISFEGVAHQGSLPHPSSNPANLGEKENTAVNSLSTSQRIQTPSGNLVRINPFEEKNQSNFSSELKPQSLDTKPSKICTGRKNKRMNVTQEFSLREDEDKINQTSSQNGEFPIHLFTSMQAEKKENCKRPKHISKLMPHSEEVTSKSSKQTFKYLLGDNLEGRALSAWEGSSRRIPLKLPGNKVANESYIKKSSSEPNFKYLLEQSTTGEKSDFISVIPKNKMKLTECQIAAKSGITSNFKCLLENIVKPREDPKEAVDQRRGELSPDSCKRAFSPKWKCLLEQNPIIDKSLTPKSRDVINRWVLTTGEEPEIKVRTAKSAPFKVVKKQEGQLEVNADLSNKQERGEYDTKKTKKSKSNTDIVALKSKRSIDPEESLGVSPVFEAMTTPTKSRVTEDAVLKNIQQNSKIGGECTEAPEDETKNLGKRIKAKCIITLSRSPYIPDPGHSSKNKKVAYVIKKRTIGKQDLSWHGKLKNRKMRRINRTNARIITIKVKNDAKCTENTKGHKEFAQRYHEEYLSMLIHKYKVDEEQMYEYVPIPQADVELYKKKLKQNTLTRIRREKVNAKLAVFSEQKRMDVNLKHHSASKPVSNRIVQTDVADSKRVNTQTGESQNESAIATNKNLKTGPIESIVEAETTETMEHRPTVDNPDEVSRGLCSPQRIHEAGIKLEKSTVSHDLEAVPKTILRQEGAKVKSVEKKEAKKGTEVAGYTRNPKSKLTDHFNGPQKRTSCKDSLGDIQSLNRGTNRTEGPVRSIAHKDNNSCTDHSEASQSLNEGKVTNRRIYLLQEINAVATRLKQIIHNTVLKRHSFRSNKTEPLDSDRKTERIVEVCRPHASQTGEKKSVAITKKTENQHHPSKYLLEYQVKKIVVPQEQKQQKQINYRYLLDTTNKDSNGTTRTPNAQKRTFFTSNLSHGKTTKRFGNKNNGRSSKEDVTDTNKQLKEYIIKKLEGNTVEHTLAHNNSTIAKIDKVYDKNEHIRKFNKHLFQQLKSSPEDKSKKDIIDLRHFGGVQQPKMAKKGLPDKPIKCGVVLEKVIPEKRKITSEKQEIKRMSAFDTKLRLPLKSIAQSFDSNSAEVTTLTRPRSEPIITIEKKPHISDKYKGVTITYVTIKRQVEDKMPEDTFFPSTSGTFSKPKDKSMAEIIAMRYDFLKKMREEFLAMNSNTYTDKIGNFERISKEYEDVLKKNQIQLLKENKDHVEINKSKGGSDANAVKNVTDVLIKRLSEMEKENDGDKPKDEPK